MSTTTTTTTTASIHSNGSADSTATLLQERREQHHDADIVIVGAGIIGTALAVAFGKQGRSVILLEKSLKQPDRIVGELLQPGGVQALEKLGLLDCLEGIDSIPVHGYEVIYYNDPVNIPYPILDEKKDNKRPQGRSFHHGRFVQKLREAASNTPNVTVIESDVTDLVKNEWTGQVLGVEAKTKGQKDFYFASLTFVADGYASKLRGVNSARAPVTKSRFHGFILRDCVLPAPLHGHVLLGNFSPILMYQIGSNEVRILIDIPEGCPTAKLAVGGVKNHLKTVVYPVLPESVQPAFQKCLDDNDTVRSMTNSWLPPKTNTVPGVVVLGDAMNMRHPLTGGGMTVAFNDAVLISNLLAPEKVSDLNDTKKVLAELKSFHWKRKDVTAVINILAQALYSLFAASGEFHRATILFESTNITRCKLKSITVGLL
jgi:squalene monooxygenase